MGRKPKPKLVPIAAPTPYIDPFAAEIETLVQRNRRRLQQGRCIACGCLLKRKNQRLCTDCRVTKKYCPCCEQVWAIDDFTIDRGQPDGRNSHCWRCNRQQQNIRRHGVDKAETIQRRGAWLGSVDAAAERIATLHATGMRWPAIAKAVGLSVVAAQNRFYRWRQRQRIALSSKESNT